VALEAGADLGDLGGGGARDAARDQDEGERAAESGTARLGRRGRTEHAALGGDAAVEAGGGAVEDALAGHGGVDDLVEVGVRAEDQAGEGDGEGGGGAEAGAGGQAGGAGIAQPVIGAVAVGEHLEAGAGDRVVGVGGELELELPLRDR
jgi:hypothetical protein